MKEQKKRAIKLMWERRRKRRRKGREERRERLLSCLHNKRKGRKM